MSLSFGDVVVLEDIEIDFSVDEIMRTPPFPRWASSTHSGEELRATVEDLHEEVESALAIRGMYRTIPSEETNIDEYDPPEPLAEAEYIVPGILTIGDGIHHPGTNASLLDGLVGDAMENVALQLARVEMISTIRDEANRAGLNTTRVFPPGTRGDGWPLENRRFMFEALPTAEIDVYLRDGRVTEPRKTFAFAMGIGAEIEQADLMLSCGDCSYAENCPYVGSIVE